MKNFKKIVCVAVIAICLGLLSCEETSEPVGPCKDNEWATAIKNGKEACLGGIQVTYWDANTANARLIITAGNEAIPPYEISATFSVPQEGIELNKAYPLTEGKLFGADPLTSGSMTLLVFDPPAQGVAGCFAGTFQLEAGAAGSPATFTYTNGRFVYYKGTVYESDFGNANNTGCNPFN